MADRVFPAAIVAKVLRSYAGNKRLLGLLLLGTGGVATLAAQQLQLLRTQSAADRASAALVVTGKGQASRPKPPAVDAKFAERLLFVLRIVVPSWHSHEAFMLGTQSVVLVARSLLSLRMARIGGDGLKARAQDGAPLLRPRLCKALCPG